ncbi:MAG: hypothetical protein R2750_00100 [Bacteroidales bacterium]
MEPFLYFKPKECFDWSPIWELESEDIVLDNDALLYETAQNQINEQYYLDAESTLKELIDSFPGSIYAESALKDLLSINESLYQDYTTLNYYYLNDSTVANTANLKKLGKNLANMCLVLDQNYSDALVGYYDNFTDSISYFDSIITLINIEHVNYLIEGNTNFKSNGNINNFVIAFNNVYLKKITNLEKKLFLNLNEQNQNKLSMNHLGSLKYNLPNPVKTSSLIYYELLVEGFVSLRIYNSMGQVVKIFDLGNKQKGQQIFSFEKENLSKSIYIC